ncbi:hypothetical protein HQN64_18990 [Enterobacteriaceae bacterium BIT-l23]|uniref:hypothetical protein n=1 Tax=Jejubacter sp. L23 TaxID=3092086 RepID=UPI001585B73D|nr:hypothetical protein [Enterobacteriaceae bacterium BIT-l23]
MSELSVKQKIQLIKNIAERNNVINSTDALFVINALESRIAELESRRVRVELAPLEPDDGSDAQVAINAGIRNWAIVRCRDAFILACKSAGIECEVV